MYYSLQNVNQYYFLTTKFIKKIIDKKNIKIRNIYLYQ